MPRREQCGVRKHVTGYIVQHASPFSSSLLTLLHTTMSQFQSCLDKFCTMTDAGSLLHLNAWHSFHQATERLDRLARLVPDDKDELAKDQEIWVEAFGKAMVSHSLFNDSRS